MDGVVGRRVVVGVVGRLLVGVARGVCRRRDVVLHLFFAVFQVVPPIVVVVALDDY